MTVPYKKENCLYIFTCFMNLHEYSHTQIRVYMDITTCMYIYLQRKREREMKGLQMDNI